MSIYIIKTKDKISSYYYTGCEIYKREMTNNIWSESMVVAEDAREDFSISYGKEEIVLYQKIKGDICMMVTGKPPKTILQNLSNSVPNIVINSIITNKLRLLYNIIDKNGEHLIINQIQHEDREWSQAEKIDNYFPHSGNAKLVELSDNMHIILYGKKMPEYQFGYREISPNKISEFKMIYATGYNITDFSYVITKHALHFVFIQSMGFMQRVVYIKKDSRGLSKPAILYDGFNVKKCLVGIKANKLCVWWIANKILNSRVSYDFGDSFNKIEIERNVKADGLNKAVFIDKTPAFEDNYIFNEVYTERDRPYNPCFLDDVNKKFNKDSVNDLKTEVDRLKRKLDKI